MAGLVADCEDWQSYKCILDCNRHMYENQIACDINFLVGENEVSIPAHKYILVSRSCVFYSMFYGPLAETKSDIRLPDIEPDVFKTLLQYLYLDEIEIKPEMVLPLLYASKKYSVQKLSKKCLKYLALDQSSENVCAILEQSHLYDEIELQNKCMEYICAHAKEVVESEDFLNICPTCLELVLKSDQLQVDEKTILKCVLKWSEKRCERNDLDITPENQRSQLGKLLYLIRFPLLGETYFTDTVTDSEILSDSEKVDLFKHFFKKGCTSKLFNYRNRFVNPESSSSSDSFQSDNDSKPIQTCIRYQNVYEDGSWYCGGEPDAISFLCNHPIMLHGVLVYGSYIGEGIYDVTCSIYDNTDVELANRRTQLKTSESQHTYPVLLETPLSVMPSRKYALVVKLISSDGLDTYQGKSGLMTVNCGGVRFTFSKSKYSRNGTDVKIGQIPGLLFTCSDDFDE